MRAKKTSSKKEKCGTTRRGRPDRSPPAKPPMRQALVVPELPASYGETRISLVCIDPHLIHAYWEVSRADLNRARRGLGGALTSVLRFYDVTPYGGDSPVQIPTFDVPVDLSAGNWYVPLWGPDKEYFVELGLLSEGDAFRPLARSRTEVVPPTEPSETCAVSYMHVTPREDDSSDDISPFTIYELPEPCAPPDVTHAFSPGEGAFSAISNAANSSNLSPAPTGIVVPAPDIDITVQAERSFSKVGHSSSPQPKGL